MPCGGQSFRWRSEVPLANKPEPSEPGLGHLPLVVLYPEDASHFTVVSSIKFFCPTKPARKQAVATLLTWTTSYRLSQVERH